MHEKYTKDPKPDRKGRPAGLDDDSACLPFVLGTEPAGGWDNIWSAVIDCVVSRGSEN